jgi:hypothetical protein
MSEQKTVPYEVFEEVMDAYRARLMTTCSVGTSSVYEKHKHYLAPPEPNTLGEVRVGASYSNQTLCDISNYICGDNYRFYRDKQGVAVLGMWNGESVTIETIYDRRK